jgi:aldose sugar dehydrogenase
MTFRSSRHFYVAAFAAALILTVVLGVTSGVSAFQTAAGAKMFDTMEYRIRVVPVAENLRFPYGMAFLPDRSILVTQLNGQLRLIRNGALVPTPIGPLPGIYVKEAVAAGATGLMDVAVHPRFAQNHFVYLTYNKSGENGSTAVLARGTFDGSQLNDVKEIFVAEAWGKNDGNASSRIVFGKDGFLYMAVSYHNENEMSQSLNSHGGKVLRLQDDGTPAPGNPFIGKQGSRPEIFTLGHRGIHGITVHPVTGDVWVNEHGDEVDILKAGGNYGWPFFGVMGAGGGNPTPPAPRGLEVIDPYISWNPALNVSGITFYSGDKFPKWKGNLFLGGLNTEQVHRVAFHKTTPSLSQPLFTQTREALFTQLGQRVRDVREGPDGFIYLLTYGEMSGALMRIEPAN